MTRKITRPRPTQFRDDCMVSHMWMCTRDGKGEKRLYSQKRHGGTQTTVDIGGTASIQPTSVKVHYILCNRLNE